MPSAMTYNVSAIALRGWERLLNGHRAWQARPSAKLSRVTEPN